MKQTTISLIIIAVLALGAGGYFFYQNQLSQAQAAKLKDEKTKVETELAVLKNSNLAKENENLQFKLDTAKKDLAVSQKEAADQKAKIGSLDAKLTKIRPYAEAIDAIQKIFLSGLMLPSTPEIASRVDPKIKALGSPELLEDWLEAKAHMNSPPGSYSPQPVGVVVTRLMNRILGFLP